MHDFRKVDSSVDNLEFVLEHARDLLERSGHPPRQIQHAGHGGQHHLLVVEVDDGPLQLLRMARSSLRDRLTAVLQSEAEAVRRAREAAPVPYPMDLLPDIDRPEACLMPVLPGLRASDLRDEVGSQHDISRICIELGRLLAKLHTVRRMPSEPSLIRTVLAEEAGNSPSLLHGDAHLGNLLVEAREKAGWKITGLIDWSFCAWGPPEADLVEMAICEAEPRPHLGRVFYEAYVDAGGLPPREPVFRAALQRELQRRLREHRQSRESGAKDRWTRWLDALRRPDAIATRIFDVGRAPGRGLT